MRKILSFFLSFFLIALISCSTNIDDGSSGDRSLKVSVKQSGANTSRAISSTPYTVEVKITENGTLLAKKSKDIAAGATTFEFNNLPANATVDVTLTIYVGQNKITSGTGSCTIIPNQDNSVEIELEDITPISSATLSKSEENKINGIIRFVNGDGITLCYSELPNIALIEEACLGKDVGTLTINLTSAGAVTLEAGYLQDLYDFITTRQDIYMSVILPQNSIINVNINNYGAVSRLGCADPVTVKLNPMNNNITYENVISNIGVSGLSNVTLDYTGSGTTVYGCPTVISNVKAVILPEGLQVLENNAFANFNQLANLTIPASVIKLGSYSFGSQTTNVIIQQATGKNWYNVPSDGNVVLTDDDVKSGVASGLTRYRY